MKKNTHTIKFSLLLPMKLMIFENRIQNRNKWCYFNSKVFHFCVAIEANKTECRHGNVAVYILILSLTDPNLKQTLLNWMCIRICVFFFFLLFQIGVRAFSRATAATASKQEFHRKSSNKRFQFYRHLFIFGIFL